MAFVIFASSCTPAFPAGPALVNPPATTPGVSLPSTPAATVVPASPTPVPTATATATPVPSPTITPTTAAGRGVSEAAAWEHVEHLSGEIGSRPAGSAAEKASADYIAGQLASYGYSVEQQTFPFQTYDDRLARLEVERPSTVGLSARPMRFSAGGDVRAAVVDAGLGRPEDFAGKDAKQKIALVQRGEITLAAKADNAMAAGATAVVVSNSEPGNFAGTLGEPGGIPAVSISLEEGKRLRDLLGQGEVVARLVLDAPSNLGRSQNVIATRAGREPGMVVVGAHMDSVPAGPGANDNASGVGAAIEVARVLAESDYPYTVTVVAFGAEEIGFVGSRHYVASLGPEQRRSIIAMVNLDMVGVGDTMRLAGTNDLVQTGLELAAEQNLSASQLLDRRADSSDHTSFQAAEVPALFITWTPDPNYHTDGDVTEYVQPETLAASGKLALAVLEVLSTES